MKLRIPLICLLVFAAGGSAFAQCLTGSATIVLSEPAATQAAGLSTGMPIRAGAGVETGPQNRAAFYLEAPATGGRASLYLTAGTQVVFCPGGDDRPHIGLGQGAVVLSYEPGPDPVPFVLTAPGAWLRLQRGTVVAAANGQGATFTLIGGEAIRFEGALPEGDVKDLPGGAALTPQPELPAARAAVDLVEELNRARVVEAAGNWLDTAEKGDLVPAVQPPVAAAPVVAALAVPAVQVIPLTPQAAVTPAVTIAPLSPGQNQAQALLASGNPASVIVGARLERTRVVGTLTGIRFNALVRRPMALGY